MRPEARRKQIIAMRDAGLTYHEIGRRLGMSRQRAHQIATKAPKDRFQEAAVSKIAYVGLRNWMLANRINISELEKWCGVKKLKLDGKSQLRMKTAMKIVEATGLSFEECFRRDD